MDSKFWIFLSILWGCKGSTNYPPDAPSNETECSRRMNYLNDMNSNTQIIFPPQLTGKWTSERCEVRTGPLYMLRSYTFYPNNTFHLLQYFYTDDSCSSISHVASIKGYFRFKDYLSSKLFYKATRITITPHDTPFIYSLRSRISSTCPDTIGKYWRIFNEYVIQDQSQKISDQLDDNMEPLRRTTSYARNNKQGIVDAKCISSMNISYDELSILRVQRRPAIDGKKVRYELLLGSSYQEKGRSSTLLKFQLPLILLNETNDCFICNMLSSATYMHVPHLTATPVLPLFFNGHWISQTCETRSNGVYTIRSYRFHQFLSAWEMETKYYSNHFCSNLLMTHTTSGHYTEHNLSEVVYGATEIDFHIEKSYLTIADRSILDTIETDPNCGIAFYWKLNVKKEIPSKHGCSSIDLANPVIRYDIIKLDMDYYNGSGNDTSYILQLGDAGSADTAQNSSARPTAFEYLLMQCDSEPQEIDDTPSSAFVKYSNLYFVFFIFCVAVKL